MLDWTKLQKAANAASEKRASQGSTNTDLFDGAFKRERKPSNMSAAPASIGRKQSFSSRSMHSLRRVIGEHDEDPDFFNQCVEDENRLSAMSLQMPEQRGSRESSFRNLQVATMLPTRVGPKSAPASAVTTRSRGDVLSEGRSALKESNGGNTNDAFSVAKKTTPVPSTDSSPHASDDKLKESRWNNLVSSVSPLDARRHSLSRGGMKELQLKSLFDADHKTFNMSISIRSRINLYLTKYNIRLAMDTFQSLLSVISCVLFVWQTYDSNPGDWFTIMEVLIVSLFVLDYIFNFLMAKSKLRFFFSWQSFVDIITILPVYVALLDITDFNLIFLRFLLLAKVMRTLRLYRVTKVFRSPLRRQIFRLVVTTTALIFIAACLILIVENQWSDDPLRKVSNGTGGTEVQFHEALYFMVVTLSTVGYGDFTPETTVAKAMVVIIIIVAAMLVPWQTSKLFTLLSLETGLKGTVKRDGNDHVIICGNFTHASLLDFSREFFHDVHRGQNTKLVILSEHPPNDKVKLLMQSPMFDDRQIEYIQGDSTDDQDLARVRVKDAKACFVLCNKMCQDPAMEDAATIIRTLALKNYDPRVRTFVQLMLPENKLHLVSAGCDHVICITELKMSLMAQACLAPGLSTLISNLIISHVAPKVKEKNHWLAEYSNGRAREVVFQEIPPSLHGRPFSEVSNEIFQETGALLFGLIICIRRLKSKGTYTERYIVLNPGSYIVRSEDVGLVIEATSVIRAAPPMKWRKMGRANISMKKSELGPKPDNARIIPEITRMDRELPREMGMKDNDVEQPASEFERLEMELVEKLQPTRRRQLTRNSKLGSRESINSENNVQDDIFGMKEGKLHTNFNFRPNRRYSTASQVEHMQERFAPHQPSRPRSTSAEIDGANRRFDGVSNSDEGRKSMDTVDSDEEITSFEPSMLGPGKPAKKFPFYTNPIEGGGDKFSGIMVEFEEGGGPSLVQSGMGVDRGDVGRGSMRSSHSGRASSEAERISDVVEEQKSTEQTSAPRPMFMKKSYSVQSHVPNAHEALPVVGTNINNMSQHEAPAPGEADGKTPHVSISPLETPEGSVFGDARSSASGERSRASLKDHGAFHPLHKAEVSRLDTGGRDLKRIDSTYSAASIRRRMQDSDEGDLESVGDVQQQHVSSVRASKYYLTSYPTSLSDVHLPYISDTLSTRWRNDCGGHIVVTGGFHGLEYFVQSLRRTTIPFISPIVILSQDILDETLWDKLELFPLIFFVQGVASDPVDLRRAAVTMCNKFVILADTLNLHSAHEAYMVDYDGILTALSASWRSGVKAVDTVVELSLATNMKFLRPRLPGLSDHSLAPPFAAGRAFASSMLESLIVQAYYNPFIISIVRMLTIGVMAAPATLGSEVIENIGDSPSSTVTARPVGNYHDETVAHPHMVVMDIPKGYGQATYGELYEHLTMEKNVLPLGIYRNRLIAAASAEGRKRIRVGGINIEDRENPLPYVWTSPPPSTKLYENDRVYVLSKISLTIMGVPGSQVPSIGHSSASEDETDEEGMGSGQEVQEGGGEPVMATLYNESVERRWNRIVNGGGPITSQQPMASVGGAFLDVVPRPPQY